MFLVQGIASYMQELAAPNPLRLRAQYNVVGTAELHTTIFQGGALVPIVKHER